jgi:hypothetical protein
MEVFSEKYTGKIHEVVATPTSTLPIGGVSGVLERPSFGRDSLVIGDTPGETLFVTGTTSILMDIYLINDGVMLVRNADCSIKGNIIATNSAILDCDSSQLHFLQDYIYHFTLFFCDSSKFLLTHSATTFNRFPISLTAIDHAFIFWKYVDNGDWTTAVVFHDAVDSLVNVNKAGEWLVENRSYSVFKNTDTLLVWYFFGDSSVVDFTFPDVDTLNGFVFDSSLSSVSGIGYHVEIDSCAEVMWGMIPLRGSDITISDSKIRTTGLMFSADSESLAGIVNGITYSDYILPLLDRTYHLINTYVNTWSFYPSDSSYLEATNSIFGECVGMGNSEYWIMNAFCDGSGGHIETTDNSFGVIFLSSMMCDVITKYQSALVIGYSSVLLGNIWATGSSVIAFINASIPNLPVVNDESIVFIDAITGPATANTYEVVPVVGSGTVLVGPQQPGDFDHYTLSYRMLGDSAWIGFDSTHHTPVYNGILGYWNTNGLSTGYYELRCALFDTYGNNLEALKQVNLLPGGIEEGCEKPVKGEYDIFVVRRSISVRSGSSPIGLSLFDVSGRCIEKFEMGRTQTLKWGSRRSGIYFVRIREGKKSYVHKVVLF